MISYFLTVVYSVLNLDADNLPDKSPLLARAPTLTKAFNLQAKFMHYKKIHKDPQRHTETTLDIPGLMIMYTTRVPIPPKNDRYVSHWCRDFVNLPTASCSPMPNGIPPDGPSFDTFSEDDTHQVSRLSGETVDPLRNVNHQCSCLHISTATLESRASYTGPPIVLDRRRDFAFHDVDTVRCSNPLVETSLFSKDGIPYAAALQRPGNAIVFTNLNNREHGSIICNAHTAFPGSVSTIYLFSLEHGKSDTMLQFHRIQTFRVLPEQNEILVIRRISRPVDPDWVPAYEGQRREYLIEGHVIELYEIPTIVPGMFLNVSSIDDVGPLSSLADSFDFPDTWDHVSTQGTPSTEAQGNPAPPPALSLFMRTKDFTEKKKKPRMELWNIFPTRKPTRDGTSYCWRYDLRGSVVQQSSREGDHDLKMTMHPGIDRSLLVETYDMNIFKSAAPKVRALRRYAHPSMLIPTNYEEPLRSPDVQEEILSKGRYRRPSHKVSTLHDRSRNEHLSFCQYCTIPLPVDVQYKLGELGTLSVSWEETVGRACLVYGEDNRGRSRTIQILDFASDSNRGLVRMHAET